MLSIHNSGIGVAGVFSHEIAEAKSSRTIRVAREAGFPLMVTTEPE
jgi:ATP-dependent Clp protease adaptor protein ClpS